MTKKHPSGVLFVYISLVSLLWYVRIKLTAEEP